MVGNAEPVKEYNYRPLSKLCECQLDVNDQVSTKGLVEGEGGLTEREGKEREERERETGFNFFSHLSQWRTCNAMGPELWSPAFPALLPLLLWDLFGALGMQHRRGAPAYSRTAMKNCKNKDFLGNNSTIASDPLLIL